MAWFLNLQTVNTQFVFCARATLHLSLYLLGPLLDGSLLEGPPGPVEGVGRAYAKIPASARRTQMSVAMAITNVSTAVHTVTITSIQETTCDSIAMIIIETSVDSEPRMQRYSH